MKICNLRSILKILHMIEFLHGCCFCQISSVGIGRASGVSQRGVRFGGVSGEVYLKRVRFGGVAGGVSLKGVRFGGVSLKEVRFGGVSGGVSLRGVSRVER